MTGCSLGHVAKSAPGSSPPRERVTPSQPGFLPAGLTHFFLAWAGCSWAWSSICPGWRAPDGGLPGKCLPGARLVPESMSHERSNPIKPLSPARPGRLPGAAPKGHGLLSSESGQATSKPPRTQRKSLWQMGEPGFRTFPASQHLSALPGQCPGFPRGNSPVLPQAP